MKTFLALTLTFFVSVALASAEEPEAYTKRIKITSIAVGEYLPPCFTAYSDGVVFVRGEGTTLWKTMSYVSQEDIDNFNMNAYSLGCPVFARLEGTKLYFDLVVEPRFRRVCW